MATLETFAACAALAPSPFWEAVYREAGRGVFPQGYSLRDGVLTHRTKKKTLTLACPADPADLLAATQAFFRQTSSLMSPEDRTSYWLRQSDPVLPTKWSKVKNQNQRRQLVEAYLRARADALGLSPDERAQARRALSLGFCLQAFPSVEMDETGAITDIEGFLFDPERRVFHFVKPKLKARKPVAADTPILDEHTLEPSAWTTPWERFLGYVLRTADPGSVQSATPLFEH